VIFFKREVGEKVFHEDVKKAAVLADEMRVVVLCEGIGEISRTRFPHVKHRKCRKR
jgi:hypothetical protein